MGIAYTNSNKKIVCIVGPTATGKTDVGLLIAKKYSGEIIACDSRQVYKNLDLGTGKEANQNQIVSKHEGYWKIDNIKIWLYDKVSFKTQYSVSDYIKDATRVVQIITQQYKLPVIVGGTGFYLDSLLDGINSDEIPVDQILRNSLENQSIFVLQEKLKKIDEEYYYNLNNSERNNPRRLIRKIEILEYLNKHPQPKDKKEGLSKNHQILKIGLTADKKILDKRIEKRVVKRIEQGMLEETKKLITEGLTYERMRELGLEYSVMADFFEGVISTKDEFVFILQQKIKQYAKRQMTWFKRDKQIFWIDINEKNYVAKVEKLVQDWYNT